MLKQTITRIRRNHGLEHATIHVLSEKYKSFSAQGNSDHRGFHLNIYGDIDEEEVIRAVEEAYIRLKSGEHELAVHPNCGTALLTTATMAALSAQAAFSLEQRRQRRSRMDPVVLFNALPSAILAVVFALIISRPLGLQLQAKYTTSGDLGNMRIVRIRRVQPSPITRLFHFLLTGGNPELKAKSYQVETAG